MEKNKKKFRWDLVLYALAFAFGAIVTFILTQNIFDKLDSNTNNSNVVAESNSNKESNTQENAENSAETNNSNVVQNSTAYTINDIVGTFESENAKLFISSKGIFSQDHKEGCGIYEGNYILDKNIVTLYPIVFFTCELTTTEVVKDKTIKVEIVSKDELNISGTKYKRIDSKDFDDSEHGIRYLFEESIKSLSNE